MTFSDAIKNAKNRVTNMDEGEWQQAADFSAEELISFLKDYTDKKDADQTMAYVIMAMLDYFEYQDERFDKRAAMHSEETEAPTEAPAEEQSVNESRNASIQEGLKRILG